MAREPSGGQTGESGDAHRLGRIGTIGWARSREARAEYAAAGHDTVIKPKPLVPAVPGGFTLDDFTIDERAATVTCPAGNTRPISKSRTVTFGKLCAGCPLRDQCTTSQTGRSMSIHEHEALLRAARAQGRPHRRVQGRLSDPLERGTHRRAPGHPERAPGQAALSRGGEEPCLVRTRAAAVNVRTLLRHGLTRRHGAWTLAPA